MEPAEFKTAIERVLSTENRIWSSSCVLMVGKFEASETLYAEYQQYPMRNPREDITRFSLNLTDNILYLLTVSLQRSDRGKGIGARLYELIIEIGKAVNADCVVQTASGWTPSGETRREYLLRRGWKDRPGSEMEVYYRLRCAR